MCDPEREGGSLRLISFEQLHAFAEEQKVDYCELSAKDGTGVDELMTYVMENTY